MCLMARTENVRQLANFIWSVADLLRGDYKQADYGKVILPFTVLRRLDCVLEPIKETVMEFYENKVKLMKNLKNPEPLLNQKAGVPFHNISQFTFARLKADPDNIAANLKNFINGFSAGGEKLLIILTLAIASILWRSQIYYFCLIVKKFAEIDLHPDTVSNRSMGYVFVKLIRKFSELSNETAGEHLTPREVIRLMVNLLFQNDQEVLTQKGIVKTIYDPACGRGGKLSAAEEYIKELNLDARPVVFGQELNPESYAICKSDMLIKGQNVSNIKFGNSFANDGLERENKDVLVSKIFNNEDFGYWRITVERPLRLNFQSSEERLARLETEPKFVTLAVPKKRGGAAIEEIEVGRALQESIKTALRGLGAILYKNRDQFETILTAALKAAEVKIAAPVKKAILNALSERDETAEICTNNDGNKELDTDLRDYENVPLKDDIDEYMRREVLPHVPDAWVDENKPKIGYEILFTRHFYEYVPPRSLEEIEREIKELEDEIRGMLEEVL